MRANSDISINVNRNARKNNANGDGQLDRQTPGNRLYATERGSRPLIGGGADSVPVDAAVQQQAEPVVVEVATTGLRGTCLNVRQLGLAQTKNGIWLRRLDLLPAS
jgi:hypothetical protein